MERILEKLFLVNIKGHIWFIKKKFGLGWKQFLFPVVLEVLELRGIILPSPIMAQSKNLGYKTFIFKHN
jgi:hypothetical protein